MEKPHRMAQIYGYIVCLVSVITFIICLSIIVPAVINLSDPLHSSGIYNPPGTPSLASFENYKMDILKSMNSEKFVAGSEFIPDDVTFKSMYEAAKADRIQTAILSARRSIIVSGLLIIVSIALFISHWFWIRSMARKSIMAKEYETV